MANRLLNKYRIVMRVRELGQTSRNQLADDLDINLPTISNLTRELIDAGLLRAEGFDTSAGGRRAEKLALNPNMATAIGIEVSYFGVRGVLAGAGGQIFDREEGAQRLPEDPREMLDAILAVGEALLSRALPSRRPVGIGVGIAGLNDEAGRVSRRFPHRKEWKDIPLAERLEARLNIPALLTNDVQAATFGEFRTGVAKGVQNALYVHMGQGIACGIVAGGRLYAGATRNAGEFGHTIVDPLGPICHCGNYGCLESLASPAALREQALVAIGKGVRSSLAEGGAEPRLSAAAVFEAADAGDRLAANVVQKAAEYIGLGLANLVNVLNPDLVVFGGEVLTRGYRSLNEGIERTFRARVLPILPQETRLQVSILGRDAASLGGALLVFEELFQSPERLFTQTAQAESRAHKAAKPAAHREAKAKITRGRRVAAPRPAAK